MLSVTCKPYMLSVNMQSVVMLSVVMLSVMEPTKWAKLHVDFCLHFRNIRPKKFYSIGFGRQSLNLGTMNGFQIIQ